MMKKFLSLLLTLAMLLGCAAMAEAVDYTGVWVLSGAISQNVELSADVLAMMGMNMTVTLGADGSCTMDAMGETMTGVWTTNDLGIAMTDTEGETVNAAYTTLDTEAGAQDVLMVVDTDGTVMLMTREGEAPAIAAAEETVALKDVPVEAFEGAWVFTYASTMGMTLSAEMTGTFAAIAFEEGICLYYTTDEAGELYEIPVDWEIREEETATVMELSLTDETTGVKEVLMTLSMSSAGELFLTEDGVTMYFVLQVEEEAAAE